MAIGRTFEESLQKVSQLEIYLTIGNPSNWSSLRWFPISWIPRSGSFSQRSYRSTSLCSRQSNARWKL
jgi:hypothetical protein